MSTMNISLPDTLKSFVDEQISQRDIPAWMQEPENV
ncbi:hypothetical protein CCAE64S_02586 [Castellaniella caeni]